MKTGTSLGGMTKDERKARPMARGLIDYFPDALAAVSNVSHVGNEQHNPGQPLHWSRGQSDDHDDCLLRHFIARGALDNDGVRHSAKAAWRALAILQLEIEGETNMDKVQNASTVGECNIFLQQAIADIQANPSPTYYIAGPMRGYRNFNFPAFDKCRDKGRELGYNMISPADLDREAGLIDDTPTGNEKLTQKQIDACLDRDLAAIRELNPKTDGIVVLSGYRQSVGAMAEIAIARWRGLEVLWSDFKTVLHERRTS